LLVCPISRHSRPRTAVGNPDERGKQPLFANPARGVTVVGIAVSFPASTSDAAVGEFVVGSAGPAPA
jgi:hypothetical protein